MTNNLIPLDEAIWTLRLNYQLLKRQYHPNSTANKSQKRALLAKLGVKTKEILNELAVLYQEIVDVPPSKTE